MADLFGAFIKASKLVRKRRPLSAALALQKALSPAPAKRSRAKTASPSKAASASGRKGTARKNLPRPAPGTFLSDEYRCRHGTIEYRLYTPRGSDRRRLPLVVMLHGCSQTATDFAAGTEMNRLADELGVLVLYPQQSPKANLGRCWNWHDPVNQERGKGEPAIIAGLTRHAIALGRANASRVYIAGISAGGAAAAIIGAAYPDLYVAVGVHSGVARGNVRSLSGAIAAMRGRNGSGPTGKLPRQLPTIVFHGDNDRVVHPSNAGGFLTNLERSTAGPLISRAHAGVSPGGRHYSRRIHRSHAGEILLEDWTIHGGGHSWSGGSAAGSHTDPAGPSASREMLRFFLSRRRFL
ncbi:alpha/beta hydrolase family esterase [Sphingobium sp.]|uniref:extracellular catalytic domain type 1 short-chain-length polyhydroxyalkanoate depolymerase n=1 Tax=Sphingobium sp. TaxID=1912891 RepID=UPI002B7C3374|nr:PHB depolymerase family esterase [Sphingobium sp.]HUD90402.1 PHB depolymerase family esterase [Sphingobium sp.]